MSSLVDTTGPEAVEALFERQLDVGLHHGAQLVVYADGERVVDLAGGTTAPDGEATTPETRHLVWSVTKPLAGVCVHRLVDEDALAYDDPLVDHWPEFARGDGRKESVTVRHVLSHQTGMPTSPLDGDPSAWGDWDAVVETMESTELTTEPGTTAAYHTLTYGWLVGELVRRVAGTGIRRYAAENVFEPLGMDHTSIGIGEEPPETVATITGAAVFDRFRDPEEGLGSLDPPAAAALGNDPDLRRAVVPATTGVSTARDIARFFACLGAGGEFGGGRLLREETVEAATTLQIETSDDGTLSRPMRYAMGVWRGGVVSDPFGTLSTPSTVGHSGLGSAVGWVDLDDRLAFAFVCNGLREGTYEHVARVNQLADAVRGVYGSS